jgi:hypothetical protein
MAEGKPWRLARLIDLVDLRDAPRHREEQQHG